MSENIRKNKLVILFTVVALFVMSLIPMYIIGMYSHPSVDDYFYGDVTRQVYLDTHSIGAVFRAAYDEMLVTYEEWQGNFSAIFLMRLQPGIFGESFYFIAPFILITSYVGCSLFFFYTVLKMIFKADSYRAIILAISVSLVSMQLVATPSDSFYWFNGSIYYTFFYCLMLLVYALMIRVGTALTGEEIDGLKQSTSTSKVMVKKVILTFISMVLAFFIGGSNFATALFTVIIFTLCVIYYVYKIITIAVKKASVINLICFGLVLISMLFGLFISIKAPGNSIRQESVGGSTGLVLTFAYTFTYAAYSLFNMLKAPVVVFIICIIPVLYHIVKKLDFKFGYPLLVLIFTFGLYASQGTPVFYAQGLRIPYRMMNIIYFSAYSFIGFNLLYTLGWLSKKYGDTSLLRELEKLAKRLKTSKRGMIITFIVCILLFFSTCVGKIEVGETENKSGKATFSNMVTSIAATYSLINGEAKVFDAEMKARDEYLSNSPLDNDVVPALSAYPQLIFRVDITEDPGDWHNAHVAKFYHKNTVRLKILPE